MDAIMWTLIGIALYLAIGYIFVCLSGANEDDFWNQVKVMLFWPLIVILFCICCVYFGCKELNKNYFKKGK